MSKLSPLLREATHLDAKVIDCIVEVKKDKVEYVEQQLQEMGIKINKQLISQPVPGGDCYIPAWIPSNRLLEVTKIEGVVEVYKNLPRAFGNCGEDEKESFYIIHDVLLGSVKIPAIEVPKIGVMNAVVPNIPALLGTLAYPLAGANPIMKIKIFTTGVTASILKEDIRTNDGAGVTVAILDTGAPAAVPQFMPKDGALEQYTLWPEPPLDFHGHGCVEGKHQITTTLCRTMSLEEFWNRVNSEAMHVKDGEFKRLDMIDFVNTEDMQTRILGAFRTSADQSIKIKTKDSAIQTTTWHKLFTNLGELEAKDVLKLIEDGTEVSLLTEGRQYVEVKRAKLLDHHEKYFYDLTTEAQRYAVEGIVVHNSWCHDCVCGLTAPCPYGMMTGMAPAVERSIHVKVLNTFPGCGSTWQILKGIEIAVKRGAKVISMSLGGPSDGNCITDPEAKVVNKLSDMGIIFAIAMGNSGPKLWTGGSPGISLKAVTVASASILDNFKPAWWSSRGPGGKFDKKHEKEYFDVLKKYGDLAIKPDCSCTGGGRAEKHTEYDEIIWSGETGWMECLVENTKILTSEGDVPKIKEIKDVCEGDIVYTFVDGVVKKKKVLAVMDKGIRDVYRVVLRDREITATPNHPFLVFNLKEKKLIWRRLFELKKDDMLVCLRERLGDGKPFRLPENSFLKETTEDFCRLCGFFLGDGWLAGCRKKRDKKGNYRIHLAAIEMKEKYVSLFEKVFKKKMSPHVRGLWRASSKEIYTLFKEIGLDGNAHTKKVPEWVYSLPRGQMLVFLEGYIDADGYVRDKSTKRKSNNKNFLGKEVHVYYKSASRELVQGIRRLTRLLGFRTRSLRKVRSPMNHNEYHYVSGFTPNKIKFGHLGKNARSCRKAAGRHLSFDHFILRKVEKIEYAGKARVYDLTIEDSHNFIAEGIVVHNSFYDGIKDATGGFHGTSQATPHVAGLIACLVSDGIVDNSDDVKKHLKSTAEDYIVEDPLNSVDKDFIDHYGKSIATGWGLFKLSRFKR